MAFCAITEKNLEQVTHYVFTKIKENPSALKDFKIFAKELFADYTAMKSPLEKAVTLVGYLPQMVSEYNGNKDNRKALKEAGISLDAIRELEDTFDDYKLLTNYLGLQNEVRPVVIVNEKQMGVNKQIADYNAGLTIEMIPVMEEGKAVIKRKINNRIFHTRVTSMAKVGYDDPTPDNTEEVPEHPSLKHGNTIDRIGKAIFNEEKPVYEDYKELMSQEAFNAAVNGLATIKLSLEQQGFVFNTAVTVYNRELGISGEIDLLGVNSNGEVLIMDFKTANQRFTDSYLKNENLRVKSDKVQFDYGVLSKWQQYATQGHIYGILLNGQLSVPIGNKIGIIGMNLVYDDTVPSEESTITKIGTTTIHYIPTSDIRSIYKDKSLKQIYDQFKVLEKESLGSVSEIKPNVKKAREELNDPLESIDLDRIALVNEKAATQRQLKQEIDWLTSTFGRDLVLRIDTAINTGLFGNFKLNGITLYQKASRGTGYHEGWHHFTQIFLSRKQKANLYNSVADDAIDFRSRDGRKLNTATASFLDTEEFLAEEFAKFALDPIGYRYPKQKNTEPRNIFQRIWDFLTHFFREKNHPIELFQKLYRGQINNYVPSVDNAYWGNLNSIAVTAKGEEIISNERLQLYRESMDTVIGEILDKSKKTFTAFKQSKKLQQQVIHQAFVELDKVRKTRANDQQAQELLNILNNRYDFTKVYLTMTSYESLKGTRLGEDVFVQNLDEATIIEDEEIYDELADMADPDNISHPDLHDDLSAFNSPGNEKSAYSLADDAIQDFFRTIPQIKGQDENGNDIYDTNELGFKRNHKYYDVFYRTKKIMSGAFEMEDFLGRMNDRNNQRLFPELKIIARKYRELFEAPLDPNMYRNIQNVQFIQAFFNAMVMPEIKNTQLFLNFLPLTRNYTFFKPTMASYRGLSRSLTLKIIAGWEKNFKGIGEKKFTDFDNLHRQAGGKMSFIETPLYLNSDGKMVLNPYANFDEIFDQQKKGIRDFFEILGIEFNPKVLDDKDAIRKLRDFKSKFIKNIQLYGRAKEDPMIEDLENNIKSQGLDPNDYKTVPDLIEAATPQILDSIATKYFINNPISAFNEKYIYQFDTVDKRGKPKKSKKSTDPLRFIIEEMAELEEKFGDRVSSGSFRVEDKTKYPYYLPNQLILTTSLINKMMHLGEFNRQRYLQHINPNDATRPWMKRSYFFQQMFNPSTGERMRDQDGKPIDIVVEDIASHAVLSEAGLIEKHPRSLTKDEKYFFDVISLYAGGAIETPRAETSSTIMSVRLSDYGNESKLAIPLSTVLDTEWEDMPEEFHSILKNYMLGEIEKRQWFIKNDPNRESVKTITHPDGTKEKVAFAEQFNIFEDILSQDLKNRIAAKLDLPADQILTGDILTDFRKETGSYFGDLATTEKLRLEALPPDYKVILRDTAKATSVQAMHPFAKAFVYNQFILSAEFYQIYFGDLYFYKNPFKRGKFTTNTGNAMYIDTWRNDLLNRLQKDTLHSIVTGEQAGGKDFSKLKTGIINDIEMKSAYVNQNDDDNILLVDIMNMRVASGAVVPGTDEYTAEFKKVKANLKKYEEMNIADGQGIISIDFYRNFNIIMDNWDEKKENEYMRQKAIFRNHFQLYFKMVDGEKVAMEGDELDAEIAKDKEWINTSTDGFFNPLKISYTGPQSKAGVFSPVFDKFSVRPIIPEAAIGKRDEALLLRMAEQDIDYLKFESGTKVHQENSFDWYEKLGKGEYNLNNFDVKEVTTNELQSAFLKHQLSTEGIKEENILGSQFRKIVFGIKYSPLVRNNFALVNHFNKLEREFFDRVTELLNLEQDDLFSLLGIEQEGSVYKVTDMKRFLQLLIDESIKRGVPINNIDYIQYDEVTKNAKYPIDYAFNRQQIQDLLAGLIDDRLRRLKVNGSSLIQVSSAGFENKQRFSNATREDIQRYGTSGLHYYHVEYDSNGVPLRTSTMGIKTGLTKNFRALLKLPAPLYMEGEKEFGVSKILEAKPGGKWKVKIDRGQIGTIERLNKAMKDPEWKAKYMQQFLLVGYRIPTQNNNFIDYMEIMEFLPEASGGIIIPPPEIVVKSGSDFDIDKMNILSYSLSRSGRIVDAPENSYEEIAKNIKSLTYQERDIKAAKKDIESSIRQGQSEVEELYRKQNKIRFTLLDMAIKSNSDRWMDSFTNHIQNKEIFYKDDAAIPDEKAFAEADPEKDIEDKELMQMKAFRDFIELDKQISRYLIAIKAWNDESLPEVAAQLNWFNQKRQYKNHLNNEILTTLTKTLSHPYYFELLVTPSSSQNFDGYTNDLIASTQNLTPEQFAQQMSDTGGRLFDKTYTPAENIQYGRTLEAFDNLLSKRKDLGGYAIQRTFSDMFNFIGFSIAKNYSDKEGSKQLYIPLIPPQDRNKVIENGRILMHGESVSGIPIKDSFDELITLTVDLANTGAYPFMNINNYNRKHVQYLLHQKVDPKNVLWFINQPILKEVYAHFDNQKRKIQGYTLKHAITEIALRKGILKNPFKEKADGTLSTLRTYEILHSEWVDYDAEKAEEEGRDGARVPNAKKANQYLTRPWRDLHQQNLTDTDYFSFENMDADIRSGDTNTALQKKVLAYFASSIEEADAVMRLEFANNVDTTKYATLTSLIRNRSNREIVYNSKLFDRSQIMKLEKESMIAPFDYTGKAYEINKTLFPNLYTDKTINMFSSLVNDVFGARNVQIERISKIIENDYIEYIYKNFGSFEGKNLSKAFENLLFNMDNSLDHEFYTNRLNRLLAKYDELRGVPFVNALYEDVYMPPFENIEESYKGLDNLEIRNVFFLRNPDNPTFERNVYTSNWRDLINFSPEKLGLKEIYSDEDVQEISAFFHELVYFSLYQSGLTNTGNGFSDLIPYEHWAHFVQSAFAEMRDQIETNSSLADELMKVFELRFKQMNPKVNWSTKTVLTQQVDENYNRIKAPIYFFKNYFRAKDYYIEENDKDVIKNVIYYSDEEVEKGVEKEGGSVEGQVSVGSYVKFNNVVHIVVKKMKAENVWQIYNPTIKGIEAKKPAFTKDLEVMPNKGYVVDYGKKQYLVTERNEIIDLSVNNLVTWGKDNDNRKKIVAEADRMRAQNRPQTNEEKPDGEKPAIDPC